MDKNPKENAISLPPISAPMKRWASYKDDWNSILSAAPMSHGESAEKLFVNTNEGSEKRYSAYNLEFEGIQDNVVHFLNSFVDYGHFFSQYYVNLSIHGRLDIVSQAIAEYFSRNHRTIYGCPLTGKSTYIFKSIFYARSILPPIQNPTIFNTAPEVVVNKVNGKSYLTAIKDIPMKTVITIEKSAYLCNVVNCVCINNYTYACNHCSTPVKFFLW